MRDEEAAAGLLQRAEGEVIEHQGHAADEGVGGSEEGLLVGVHPHHRRFWQSQG